MSILDKIWIKYTSKFIAEDPSGNKYYESSRKNYLGKKTRYIIYSKEEEPSKVPPVFHAWLHYLENDVTLLSENIKMFDWQKNHQQNTTGTTHAYNPIKKNHKRAKISSDYQIFQPNKEVS